MPSSVARLRASASVEPDCQLFVVSTSSHHMYRAGELATRSSRAAGVKNETMLFSARTQPYYPEQAGLFVPSQSP